MNLKGYPSTNEGTVTTPDQSPCITRGKLSVKCGPACRPWQRWDQQDVRIITTVRIRYYSER